MKKTTVAPHVGENEVMRQQVQSNQLEEDSAENKSEVEYSTSEIDVPTDAAVIEIVDVSETGVDTHVVHMHSAGVPKTVGS